MTASRDGYAREHALAELWSNQHNKWFVVDVDYNIVYERDGVPLSAFEICHQGRRLQRNGELKVRHFAPPKPSLPLKDLVPYYRYVHIDMRSDWNTRPLERGSPAGGDLATWWTARSTLGNILTPKVRVDDRRLFNWKVNRVSMQPVALTRKPQNRLVLEVGLLAYSPFFRAFEVSINEADWREQADTQLSVLVQPAENSIRARVVTENGWRGPVYEVRFEYN